MAVVSVFMIVIPAQAGVTVKVRQVIRHVHAYA